MKKILFASALAAVAMMGCSTTTETEPIEGAEVPVLFGQSIEVYTKAAITSNALAENSVFSVYALEKGTATPSTWATPFMDNIAVKVENSGLTYTGTKYYSNTTAATYDFHAVYPQIGGSETGLTVKTPASGNTSPVIAVDCSKQFDILYADSLEHTKAKGIVGLKFNHKLAKLTVRVVVANGYTPDPAAKITAVSIPMQLNGTMDLTNGTITVDAADGTAYNFTGIAAEGIAIPAYNESDDNKGSVSVGDDVLLPAQTIKTITISVNNEEKTPIEINGSTGMSLTAGHNNIITLTFKGSSVSFEQSVQPWGNGGTSWKGEVIL